MIIEKAQKIVHIWGTYLEYCAGKLNFLFMGRIPESFLPFPKETLEEAINIVAEHHHNLGNQKAVDDLQSSISYLIGYKDDEEALISTAKFFNDKKMRNAILPPFKDFQNEWIKTQKL